MAESGEGLETLARTAVSALDRAVTKGVLHRNNAARRKARLMKRLNAVAAEAPAPAPQPQKKASRTTKAQTGQAKGSRGRGR